MLGVMFMSHSKIDALASFLPQTKIFAKILTYFRGPVDKTGGKYFVQYIIWNAPLFKQTTETMYMK